MSTSNAPWKIIAVGFIHFILAVLALLLIYYGFPYVSFGLGMERYNALLLILVITAILVFTSRTITKRLLTSKQQVLASGLLAIGFIALLYLVFYLIELAPLHARQHYCISLKGDAPDDCYTFLENSRVIIIYYMAVAYLIFVTALNTTVSIISLHKKTLSKLESPL